MHEQIGIQDGQELLPLEQDEPLPSAFLDEMSRSGISTNILFRVDGMWGEGPNAGMPKVEILSGASRWRMLVKANQRSVEGGEALRDVPIVFANQKDQDSIEVLAASEGVSVFEICRRLIAR